MRGWGRWPRGVSTGVVPGGQQAAGAAGSRWSLGPLGGGLEQEEAALAGRAQLLLHSVRHRVVGLLEGLQTELGLVLAGDVPAHRVVAREGARAEGTGHADALVALTDVGPQVRLVAVQPLAERALELLACKENAAVRNTYVLFAIGSVIYYYIAEDV